MQHFYNQIDPKRKQYYNHNQAEAKEDGGNTAAPGRIRPVESELFHKPPTQPASQMQASQKTGRGPSQADQSKRATTGAAGAAGAGGFDAEKTQHEPDAEKAPQVSREKPPDPNAIVLSGDYLTQYLEETNGDDSQFKDIEPSVIPYTTGTSPRRERPDEFLFKEDEREKKNAALGDNSAAAVTEAQASEEAAAIERGDAPYKATSVPNVTVDWCKSKLKPMWLPIKAHRFTACRSKVLQLLPQKQLAAYVEHEKQGHYAACVKLLETCVPGNLNVFQPATLVPNKPLLVETIFQLLVGYIGLCLKNNDSSAASRLCMQTLEAMQTALRDLHPAHKAVLESYLYDTALSVAYYSPSDVQLAAKAEMFFQQASQRYLKLKHYNRFSKCCIR